MTWLITINPNPLSSRGIVQQVGQARRRKRRLVWSDVAGIVCSDVGSYLRRLYRSLNRRSALRKKVISVFAALAVWIAHHFKTTADMAGFRFTRRCSPAHPRSVPFRPRIALANFTESADRSCSDTARERGALHRGLGHRRCFTEPHGLRCHEDSGIAR